MALVADVQSELAAAANPEKAAFLQGFFRTGKGEYGEGDVLIGVTVPQQRAIAKKYWRAATIDDIRQLLASEVHEHRFTALEMLVLQYEKATEARKREIVRFYLANTARINNWDLVDTSAEYIVGDWLYGKDVTTLHKLAGSRKLWRRRIAIVATFAFIRRGRFEETLELARVLLTDKHDLIHKAVGWMLREVGKRDLVTLTGFLDEYAAHMPRTMLRYAIERHPERQRYLAVGKPRKPGRNSSTSFGVTG